MDINYLGGHQGNLKNNSCTGVTVGDDCPCGCGCNCTDAPPSAPPSSEAMEMRLHRVGYTFDGTGGYQEIDLVVKSLTAYTPWDSTQNGRYSTNGSLGTEFAQVSLQANTSTTFEYRFVNNGTSIPATITGQFDFCFFDIDTGWHEDGEVSLRESLEACGFEDYSHHGRSGSLNKKVADGLCSDPAIDTTQYMDIKVTGDCIKVFLPPPNSRHRHRHRPGRTQAGLTARPPSHSQVTALKHGSGQDNPREFADVLMKSYPGAVSNCTDYNICPCSGESGNETCAAGARDAAGMGVYPAVSDSARELSVTKTRLAGSPFQSSRCELRKLPAAPAPSAVNPPAAKYATEVSAAVTRSVATALSAATLANTAASLITTAPSPFTKPTTPAASTASTQSAASFTTFAISTAAAKHRTQHHVTSGTS